MDSSKNTTTIQSKKQSTTDDIEQTAQLFMPDDGVIELRALDVSTQKYRGPHTVSGYFDDPAKLAQAARNIHGAKGIYLTINPCDPALLGRVCNRIKNIGKGDSTTGDKNIIRRRSMVIDFDPDRPSGISASAEEKELAHQTARRVRDHLRGEDWPDPVVGDSGNGYHLVYRIDLPTDDDGIVKRCLSALSEQFSGDGVQVDETMFNPARISKLYGTLACKGDNIPDRPHRKSRIISVPDDWKINPVPVELLETLAATIAPAKVNPAAKQNKVGAHGSFDIEQFISTHFPDAKTPKRNADGHMVWVLPVCPFNPEHNRGEAYIIQRANGILGAGCKHNSCQWDWKELRAKYDPKPAGKISRSRNTKNISSTSVGEFDATDVGNADRFIRDHGVKFRYVHEWKKWLAWNGSQWKVDKSGHAISAMKETARGILAEASHTENRKRQDELISWARRSQQRERITAGLALAHPDLAIAPDALDCDNRLLNVKNGTINLHTGELLPHNPDDYITKISPIEYDPAAQCPRFRSFINEIFDNQDGLIEYVQTLLGFCLTGEINEQILPVFWGTGANGKSTLLEIAKVCMGDYADFAPPGLLMLKRRDEHPTEIAGLAGKRLIIASETDKGGRLRVELVKQLTGEGELNARYMRGDYFTFKRTFKTILQTNNKPKVDEDSEAVWRRLRLIRFDITIERERRDPHLIDKLKVEAPGVLAWLVAGAVAWYQRGLPSVEAVEVATAVYRAESDRLAPFIDDACEVDPQAYTPTGVLRSRYVEWSKLAGERVMNQNDFAEALRKHNFTKDRVHGGRIWRGLRLLPTGEVGGE